MNTQFPDWRYSSAGAKVRAALWLHSEVGEGGVFRKAQLRDAFPGVEQIDRRMRDLRAEGWVISTYREDRSLEPDELRLVRVGGAVWERGYTSRSRPPVTDRQRRATLAADKYMCVCCGIRAGDSYPDDASRTAQLSCARTESQDGSEKLITTCDRCVYPSLKSTSTSIVSGFSELEESSQSRFHEWVVLDRRTWTNEEVLWSWYCLLPATDREDVRNQIIEAMQRRGTD